MNAAFNVVSFSECHPPVEGQFKDGGLGCPIVVWYYHYYGSVVKGDPESYSELLGCDKRESE